MSFTADYFEHLRHVLLKPCEYLGDEGEPRAGTARKAVVSAGHEGIFPTGRAWLHRQAVGHRERSLDEMTPRVPDRGDGAVIMALLRRLNPVRDAARYTDEYWGSLHMEFRFHQRMAEATCFLAMLAGFFLPWYVTGSFQPWDLGLGLALTVAAPLLYILLIAVYKNTGSTWSRYADYSTMMYAIPWKAQLKWLGFPILAIGLVCLIGRTAYPVDLSKLPGKTEPLRGAQPPSANAPGCRSR